MSAPTEERVFGMPDIVEQAGDWLLRLSEEDLPPEALGSWLEWYHADPAHREAFHQLQQEYERLKSIPGEQRQAIAQRLDPPAEQRAERGTRTGLELGVYSRRARRRWTLAAAASVLIALGAVLLQANPYRPGQEATGVVQTVRGLDQQRQLPDGTRLTLGGDSTVSYRLTADARYIVLESGEAYFDVAKDKSRPFIVHVGGMTVRAVGTAFNIRRSSERVVVTVTEGIVDVQRSERADAATASNAPAQPQRVLRLSAGQAVVMADTPDTSTRSLAVKAANVEVASAWKTGRFDFVDEPLSSVITTINRYSEREIVITDRELARMTLTGSVMRDHIDEWLESLPGIYPAKVSSVGDDTVLISLAAFREEGSGQRAGIGRDRP